MEEAVGGEARAEADAEQEKGGQAAGGWAEAPEPDPAARACALSAGIANSMSGVSLVLRSIALSAVPPCSGSKNEKTRKKEDTTMPWGDRTGPWGLGPLTGRAAGFCAGFGMPGYMNPIPGRGFARGFGRGRGGGFRGRGFGGGGRGWRHGYYATGLPGWMRFGGGHPWAAPWGYTGPAYAGPDPETEKQALKNQADALQSELDFIRKRLADLESGAAAEEK